MQAYAGTEWLVDASGCDAARLRSVASIKAVLDRAIAELGLKTLGPGAWHAFDEPGGGVTGLVMLTESHLACHTYPELGLATFNLYCCTQRPEWPWADRLGEMLGAAGVITRSIRRGE